MYSKLDVTYSNMYLRQSIWALVYEELWIKWSLVQAPYCSELILQLEEILSLLTQHMAVTTTDLLQAYPGSCFLSSCCSQYLDISVFCHLIILAKNFTVLLILSVSCPLMSSG